MNTNHTSEPNHGPRRAMRKGTRSCYECRKRKARCIFSKDSSICEGCALRGKRCIEQSRELLRDQAIESKEGLKERVARLEAVLQASNEKYALETTTPEFGSMVDKTTAFSPVRDLVSIDKDSPQNINPIVTLFDNAIWRRHGSEPAQNLVSQADGNGDTAATTKRSRTCDSLLSGLIPSELLGLLMSATCSWWHTWKPLGPWTTASIGDKNTSTIQDFVTFTLASSDPSVVGLAILSIAVCLQQLDTRVHQYILRQLPRLPGELFHEYFEKVDRLILNDSDYAGSAAGIEALILSATIYISLGLSKKSWLMFHRAIAYSQLLGFHRPERLSTTETDEERYRRNQSWLLLCMGDVFTSLILGLPYAGNGRTIPLTHSQRSPVSLLQHKLIIITARVIDRNQVGLSLSVSETQAIQDDINNAIKDLDETFWNSTAALASGKITHHEYLDHIGAQCWLYLVLVLLHMPLMIHSVKDIQLEPHHTACLDASRNLLKTYHIMRTDPHASFNMDKLIDYLAFICSALLILGLLGFGGHRTENEDKDRELIRQTITNLRRASGTVNNPVASQAVQGLETLMWLDSEICPGSHTTCDTPFVKIIVPHVGTVTISPGEHFTNQNPASTLPPAHLPPVFALSHEMLEDAMADHTAALNAAFDGGQVNGVGQVDNMFSELAGTSIDFDWTTAIVPSFENDWAWLNDLN